MSTKVKQLIGKPKIIVDNYEEHSDCLVCDCLDTGSGEELLRTVTIQEIKDHVTFNGKVNITYNNEDDYTPVTFDEWYSNQGTMDITFVCGEIINKREKRCVEAELPDLHPIFQTILNPFLNTKTA